MKSRDRAYIAGFFDGEGHIGFRKTHHGKKSGLRLYPQVVIGQKDPTILYWIQEVTGFGTVYHSPSASVARWQLYAQRDVYVFITLIYPYVKCPRRRRALRDARKLLANRGFDRDVGV